MTTNKPGSVDQNPYHDCAGCYDYQTHRAEDLRVHKDHAWCDSCWDCHKDGDEALPPWHELERFVPALQAERDKLRAELAQERERAVSARTGGEPEGVRSLLVECERALCCPDPAQRQVTASKVLRVLTAAPTAPAVQGEPVAIVDADDNGMWADILPNVAVKVGQILYAAPQPVEGYDQ